MASPIDRLRAEDCPLLAAEERERIVKQFNSVLERLAFCQALAGSPQPEKCERFGLELAKLGEELRRDRYIIGFLGPFQAGKSRTFNNVLGLRGRDQPAGVGQGFPTTAAVTRLRRSASGRNRAKVVFLTNGGYQAKRRFLLQRCGFDPAEKDDQRVLREIDRALAQWERSVRTWQDAEGKQVPVKRRDMEYLALMLKSYQLFSDRIQERPLEMEVDFDKRWEYLNHPPDPWHKQTGVVSPLLSHVELELVTDVIPATVEMVDLPGYDAHCSVDAFVTDDFLKTLQAALIFCRATDFAAAVETVVSKLRRLLGADLRGRVWLVITRCDDINIYPAVASAGQGDSVFRQLVNFLDRVGVPRDQVFFVTNEPGELQNRLNDREFRALLEASIKEALPQWPELEQRWRLLMDDGGINALRRLLVEEIAEDVRWAITRKAQRSLPEMRQELDELRRYLIDEQRCRALPADVARWRSFIREARLKVTSSEQITALATKVLDDLNEVWDSLHISSDILAETIVREGNEGLKEEFESHAYSLESIMRQRLASDWLDIVYENALTIIRDREAQAGVLRLPGICDDGLADYLQRCRQQDRRLEWLDSNPPSFLRHHPFEALPSGAEPLYSAESYLDMFDRKRRVMARELALRLICLMHRRFEGILEQLSKYGRQLPRPEMELPRSHWEELSRKLDEEVGVWE
ncbi:MAG: hypothetical protein NZ899_06350 [Thermoguttaceae bacterium]|nr:hypothetical protein [Thermoguttaceae bacterium]